ncbi:MAG: hypothetical protein ACLQED_15510 [Desulfobaccales bacterium]
MHSNIVLLDSFLKSAKLIIKKYPNSKSDIFDFINYISEHPGSGDKVPGYAGKIIKDRWAIKSYKIGARSGLRMYYYFNKGLLAPFFIYTKGQMDDAPEDVISGLVSFIEDSLVKPAKN